MEREIKLLIALNAIALLGILNGNQIFKATVLIICALGIIRYFYLTIKN